MSSSTDVTSIEVGRAPQPVDPGHGEGRVGPGSAVALRVIALYQSLRAGRPSPCRFQPSCSAYGAEAVERYGLGRGGWLALRRIARCRPFGGHGFDPVPEIGDRA